MLDGVDAELAEGTECNLFRADWDEDSVLSLRDAVAGKEGMTGERVDGGGGEKDGPVELKLQWEAVRCRAGGVVVKVKDRR